MSIPAVHRKTGHAGVVQSTMYDHFGRKMFFFEDNNRPTCAGWYYLSDLEIVGVNA